MSIVTKVLKGILNALGSFAYWILGLAFAVLIFSGPFIVTSVIPDQAYHYTLMAAIVAAAVFILCLLIGIARPARGVAGVVMFICGGLVSLFLWVWSCLIVNSTWGLGVLYFVNFFLGVGAIVAAFFATLFGAHWSLLWQIIAIGIVAVVMNAIAVAYAQSGEGSAASGDM